MVADLDAVDVLTDCLDDASGFMTPDCRQGASPRIVDVMDIAMADRRGTDPDLNLARPWGRKVQVLDRKWLAECSTNSGPDHSRCHSTNRSGWTRNAAPLAVVPPFPRKRLNATVPGTVALNVSADRTPSTARRGRSWWR